MIRTVRASFLAILILAFGTTGFATDAAAASKKKIDRRVAEALEEFHNIVSGSEELLADAAGVLIFPKVKKGGIGIGGEGGSGALQIDGKTVGYYRTLSATIGFQLGYQERRQILIFMTEGALEAFRYSKNWEIGVDGSVAIVTLDAGGSIDTESLQSPVIAFIFGAKGLMYNLTLEGTKVSPINPK